MSPVRTEQIGDCTLMLGDCLEIMPERDPVDHVFADPGYEKHMHAAKREQKKRLLRRDGRPGPKPVNFKSVEDIREEAAKLIHEKCNGWSLTFCTPEGVAPWRDAYETVGANYKRACTWVKPDSAPQFNGQGPAMATESFTAVWHGKGHARWNAGGKRNFYTHRTNNPERHGVHPTEKPVSLMCELLQDFSNYGDVILDPFMGSGTTGVACIKTGRKFIGIELDLEYFAIAVSRMKDADRQSDLFIQPPSKAKQEVLL